MTDAGLSLIGLFVIITAVILDLLHVPVPWEDLIALSCD